MRQNLASLRIARIPVSGMAVFFRETAVKNVVDYSVWGLGLLYLVGVAVSMAKV